MPRKKKRPSEMTDSELLREVFPERVAREIEKEVAETPDSPESPDESEDRA